MDIIIITVAVTFFVVGYFSGASVFAHTLKNKLKRLGVDKDFIDKFMKA